MHRRAYQPGMRTPQGPDQGVRPTRPHKVYTIYDEVRWESGEERKIKGGDMRPDCLQVRFGKTKAEEKGETDQSQLR